jgi:hypothetical protein
MSYQKLFLLLGLLCGCLVGCDAQDGTGIKIDLSHLNWQVGALIALAYLANSKGHFASLAGMAKKLLQSLKILPSDTTSEALTAEQLATLLADLFGKLQGQPELQSKVLDLMTAASASAVSTKVVANAASK